MNVGLSDIMGIKDIYLRLYAEIAEYVGEYNNATRSANDLVCGLKKDCLDKQHKMESVLENCYRQKCSMENNEFSTQDMSMRSMDSSFESIRFIVEMDNIDCFCSEVRKNIGIIDGVNYYIGRRYERIEEICSEINNFLIRLEECFALRMKALTEFEECINEYDNAVKFEI